MHHFELTKTLNTKKDNSVYSSNKKQHCFKEKANNKIDYNDIYD